MLSTKSTGTRPSKRVHQDEQAPSATAGLSFLLLLLSSALPSANPKTASGDDLYNGSSPFGTSYNVNFEETPYLAYVASMQNNLTGKLPILLRDEETTDDESDDVTDNSSSSGSDTGSSGILIRGSFIGTVNSTRCASAIRNLDAELLARIFQYLPLPQATICRRINQAFAAGCDIAVSKHSIGSAFLVWDQAATSTTTSVSNWQCKSCEGWNSLMGESCRNCGVRNGDVQRVFIGQLRKERTSEMVRWMIGSLCPDVELLHVESHTNPNDGRGKGCAWVYVSSQKDADKLLGLNKRVFMDVSDSGEEGVWCCSPTEQSWLSGFAAQQAYIPFRPIQLPRQPMVVERPRGSGSQTRKQGNSNNTRHNNNNNNNNGFAGRNINYHQRHNAYNAAAYYGYGDQYQYGYQDQQYYYGYSAQYGYESPYGQTPSPTSDASSYRHDPYATPVAYSYYPSPTPSAAPEEQKETTQKEDLPEEPTTTLRWSDME